MSVAQGRMEWPARVRVHRHSYMSGLAIHGGPRILGADLYRLQDQYKSACTTIQGTQDVLADGQIIIMYSTHGANVFATSSATPNDGSACQSERALWKPCLE